MRRAGGLGTVVACAVAATSATATASGLDPVTVAGAPANTAAAATGAAAPPRINTSGRELTIVVPLRASVPLGQVQVTLEPDDTLLVSVQDFVAALSRIVRPAELDRIRAAADDKGRLSAAAADKLGYRLSYDAESVEMVVQFAPSLLQTRTVSIIRGGEAGTVQPDRSARIATYLNYRIGERVQVSGPDRGRSSFLGDFELAGRLARTLAFDTFATVDSLADRRFVRTSSRLFYDLPGPALRITAGDLYTETAGLQSDPQISGINVSHLIDTFYPGAPVSGTSSHNLILNRDADVQILVNGMPVSQIHLGPGSYDLHNLPVAQGANNLQAVITDETGERRVQNFSFFQSSRLLNVGVDEYTVSVGVLAPLDLTGPNYSRRPALTGFYRRGILEQLTVGGEIQAAASNQMLGVDAVLGTRAGLFSGNVAGNHLQTGQAGIAARVQYSFSNSTNTENFARSFDALVEYRSAYFQPLSGSAASRIAATGIPIAGADGLIPITSTFDLAQVYRNTQALLATGSVTQPVRRDLYLQLNGTYTHARDGFGDRASVSAQVTYQAPFRTTLGLGITYQWAPRVEEIGFTTGRGLSFLATLTHRFGPRAILTASVDRFTQRASFSRTPEHVLDDYFINGDVSHSRFGTAANGAVGYITNRGNIQGTYSAGLNPDGSIASQQAAVFFTGSAVFADGRFGLGRRITDSFAVVGKNPTLGTRQVTVESRFANEAIARTGTFGNAVVPISSYQRALIPYDVADLPPGYDLGTGNFEIYPWYRSGFALTVGSRYNNTALGDLVDPSGSPLALRSGVASSLDDPIAPRIDVVTNRAGRFSANGLAPGRYRIVMSADATLSYDITIVPNGQMLTRLGTVRPNGH